MYGLQGEGRPRTQNGEVGLRFGRWFADRHEAGQSTRGTQTVHPTVHSVTGARLSVSRRQLSPAIVPENEASRQPHKAVQTKDQRWLSDLQAADRAVLLPRKTLSRGQVSGAILSKYQAQTEATTIAATLATSSTVTSPYGCDEYANRGTHNSAGVAVECASSGRKFVWASCRNTTNANEQRGQSDARWQRWYESSVGRLVAHFAHG